AVLGALRNHPAIDESLWKRAQAIVKRMDQLESVVLAGGSGSRVDRAVVLEAHAVTTAVIEALGVLEPRSLTARPETDSHHAALTADDVPAPQGAS
ncbi:MAG: hypothetical protein JNK04_13350, partial [Myxococcales bacterium]|nr:hypothetical protein [Myxococcales bacterium]